MSVPQLKGLKSEAGLLTCKRGDLPIVPSSVRLLSPKTMRQTLGMSRSESIWSLMHLKLSSVTIPSSIEDSPAKSTIKAGKSPFDDKKLSPPRIDFSATYFNARDKTPVHASKVLHNLSLPSDNDYHRMQNRLNKITSGLSLTLRSIVIQENKALETQLEQDEWQYVKVRLSGKTTPLELTQKRYKGKVILYLSRSVSEPNETFHDEVCRRDTFSMTEPGFRFKTDWLYIGLKCVSDAYISLSVRFGINNKSESSRKKWKQTLPGLKDLEDFRKDENKREELYQRVDDILKKRQAVFEAKYCSKNFLRENRSSVLRSDVSHRSPSTEKQRLEDLHRLKVLEKRSQIICEKRQKAETSIHKKEIRREMERLAKKEAEEKQQRNQSAKEWFLSIAFSHGTTALWDRFQAKKARLREIKRKMMAASVLQLCYRRTVMKYNPKKLNLQRALDSLSLYTNHCYAPVLTSAKEYLYSLIRSSTQSYWVQDHFSAFLRKSTLHLVILIQSAWKRFSETEQKRWEIMIHAWDAQVNKVPTEPTGGKKRKKTIKKGKEMGGKQGKIQDTVRDRVLRSFLVEKRRKFYADLAEYRGKMKLEKQNMEENQELIVPPKLVHFPSTEELLQMIQSAAAYQSE